MRPVYYDPYDAEIDADPYPVWKRLRDEAPLYYNEKYDFFALSRFDDVEKGLVNWDAFRSGKGSLAGGPDRCPRRRDDGSIVRSHDHTLPLLT